MDGGRAALLGFVGFRVRTRLDVIVLLGQDCVAQFKRYGYEFTARTVFARSNLKGIIRHFFAI
jgi:hypothetical protein